MKLLIYEEYAGFLHGNQRYINLLAENLDSSLTVLLPFKDELAKSLEDKITMYILPPLPLWKRPIAVAKSILKICPDVLLVNNERSLLIAALGAFIAGIPIVWYIKNFRKSLFIDTICFLCASRVLSISPQCIKKKGWITKFFSHKIRILPIGIPIEQFSSIPNLNECSEKLRVLLLSAITPNKGIEITIEAVRIAVQNGIDIEVKIAGAIPSKYQKFALDMRKKSEGLPIQWLGWQSNILPLFEWANVAILPSFSEGVPRSLVEAMAAGRPVVATNVGGIPDIVKHGKNGFLIEPGDPYALAKALRILAEDPINRCYMGNTAREYVTKYFDFSRHIKMLKRYLSEIAKP